jgi:hypothetical protein
MPAMLAVSDAPSSRAGGGPRVRVAWRDGVPVVGSISCAADLSSASPGPTSVVTEKQSRRGRLGGSVTLGAFAELVPQPQWEHSQHRGAPAELIAVLAIKRSGVAARLRGRVVCLLSAGVAVTLAFPAHVRAFCPESVAVAEYPTAQHQMIIIGGRRSGCGTGAEAMFRALDGVVRGSGTVA